MGSIRRGVAVAALFGSFLFALPALSFAGSPKAHLNAPPQLTGHCGGPASIASAGGPWSCIDSYTRDGITKNFGDPGFDPSGTQGDGAGTPAPAQGEAGTGPASTISPQSRATRAVFSPLRLLTKSYQTTNQYDAQYGVGTRIIGTLRFTAHINLNGWQPQTKMSFLVTAGPPVDPVQYWSSGCGNDDSFPPGYTQSWAGPSQNGYCDFNGTYRNAYNWTWYAAGEAEQFSAGPEYSDSWTCNSLYTAPCYFGT